MEKEELMRAIITVAVIIIVAAVAFTVSKSFAFFKGEGFGQEEQQQYESNFEILIRNIGKCKEFQENDCLCEGLPNFPGSFAAESILVIKETETRKTRLNWTHSGKSYKDATLEDIKISAILFETKEEIPYLSKKSISFIPGLPEFIQEGHTERIRFKSRSPRVVSSKLYKKSDGMYFIVDFLRYQAETPLEPQIKDCVS